MANNCLITAGHVIDCYDVTPGVRNIYIANYDKDMTFAYDTDNVITGLTPSISATTIPLGAVMFALSKIKSDCLFKTIFVFDIYFKFMYFYCECSHR
jgi:hypothetical protein